MKTRHKIMAGILFATAVCYALSWRFPDAVDWYKSNMFSIGTNTLSRLFSLFPFSVGELLIYVGIFVLAGAVFAGFLGCFGKERTRRFAKRYLEGVLWMLVWVLVTENFHCYVMYHANTLEETYFSGIEGKEETLVLAYNDLVEHANALSLEMKRNDKGEVVYDGDLYEACKKAMRSLGDEFSYLKGYYPNPKRIWSSDFMSQQYLAGIYFPFTLEANYNGTMYIMNRPATICHELSHLKGVILEDEANFFGFLACIRSKDPFVAYSGYLSVLGYVSREVRNHVDLEVRKTMAQPSELVQKDAVFLTKEEWERVEKKAVLKTETVNKATDAFLEGNLKANGVTDGIASYSRVVRLILKWYEKACSPLMSEGPARFVRLLFL